jgi:hypothetical protein
VIISLLLFSQNIKNRLKSICLVKIRAKGFGRVTRWRSWLRRYATSRKVAGSRADGAIDFFSIYLILSTALGPGVYSASNRNEYQKQKISFWEHIEVGA